MSGARQTFDRLAGRADGQLRTLVVEGDLAAKFDLDSRLHVAEAMRRGRHDELVRAVAGHADVRYAQGGETHLRAHTNCRRCVRIEDLCGDWRDDRDDAASLAL